MTKKKLTYESAAKELTEITQQLESNEVSIDELEKLVKRGRELVIFCQEKLRTTQEMIDDVE